MKNRKTHSRRRKGSCKNKKGGYTSAADYMLKTVGTGNEQYNDVFDQSKSHTQSNAIVSLNGKQHAGKRRSKTQKGGFWGSLLKTAAVPLAILGLQQTFGRRKRGGKKTRRY